jgi:hypothetical protein
VACGCKIKLTFDARIMESTFFYGKDKLTVKKAVLLAEQGLQGALASETVNKIQQSQRHVQQMVLGFWPTQRSMMKIRQRFNIKYCKAIV